MISRLLGRYISALLIVLPLASLQAWAGPDAAPIPEATILNTTQAYKFAREEVARIRAAGDEVESVELYHVGPVLPAQLKDLAEAFHAEGVRYVPVPKNMTQPELEYAMGMRHDDRFDTDAWEGAKVLRYESGAKDSEEEARKRFTDRARELRDSVRSFFGVPNGVSFAMYRTKRHWTEKAVEGGLAIAKAVVSGSIIYHSVSELALKSHMSLNPALTVVIGSAFGLFFDYFQRGNSDFKGQGQSWDPETGQFAMNRKFFLFSALMHSVIMREAMMAASHLTLAAGVSFTMGWNDFGHVLVTSALGWAGKIPIEMALQKARANHGKWWGIGVMSGWGVFWSALQVMDMFKVKAIAGLAIGDTVRYTLLGTTALSLAYFGISKRHRIADWARRIWNRATGTTEELNAKCQTLMIFRRTPK